jgi:hypothetical protein
MFYYTVARLYVVWLLIGTHPLQKPWFSSDVAPLSNQIYGKVE